MNKTIRVEIQNKSILREILRVLKISDLFDLQLVRDFERTMPDFRVTLEKNGKEYVYHGGQCDKDIIAREDIQSGTIKLFFCKDRIRQTIGLLFEEQLKRKSIFKK